MNEQELHVLRLLTVSAITYAEWKEIIISRMKGNEEIAKLFMDLPIVQGTANDIQLFKLKDSNVDIKNIVSIQEIVDIIN